MTTPSIEPRLLYEEEIADILASLGDVDSSISAISATARDEIASSLSRQIRRVKLVPLGLPDFKATILKTYEAAKIQAGTTVGVLAGASIGAPTTQMALNTFHAAGSSKNVSAGVGKMKELITVSPNPKDPSCSIYFNDRRIGFDKVLTDVRPVYVQVNVGALVSDYDVDFYDQLIGEEEPYWYDLFRRVVRNDFDTTQFILRLFLNVKTMYSYKVTMKMLADSIEGAGGVICVYSPLHLGIMDIYPIANQIQDALGSPSSAITPMNASIVFLNTIILPSLDNIIVQGIRGITGLFPINLPVISAVRSEIPEGSGRGIWFLEYNRTRMISSGIVNEDLIELVQLSGMNIIPLDPSYKDIYLSVQLPPSEDEETVESPMERMRRIISDDDKLDRAYEEENKRPRPVSNIALASKLTYADSNGSNLKLLLGREDVDSTHTTSSDVHEILSCLGIEASRNFLIMEFIRVISNEGSYVNNRHLSILVDFVTNQGRLMPMTFAGATRQPSGPMSKASFEQPMKTFREAGGYGSKEAIDTVSTSVYVGKRALIGTGYIDILLDEEAIAAQEELLRNQEKIDPQGLADAIWNLDGVTFGGDYTQGSSAELDMMFQTSSAPSDRPRVTSRPSIIAPTDLDAVNNAMPILTRTAPIVSNLLVDTMRAAQVPCTPVVTPPRVRRVGTISARPSIRSLGEIRRF